MPRLRPPHWRSARIRCSCSVLGHLVRPLPRTDARHARGYIGGLLLPLGLALCATKDWQSVEWCRLTLTRFELASAPNLFQFQSQLGAVALYFGVLWCPLVWPLLESAPFRHIGRLSFSIYLLHFPILFTVVCVAFPLMPSTAAAFVLFLALTLAAAIAFERLVDRPAIALSRRAGIVPLVSPGEMT